MLLALVISTLSLARISIAADGQLEPQQEQKRDQHEKQQQPKQEQQQKRVQRKSEQDQKQQQQRVQQQQQQGQRQQQQQKQQQRLTQQPQQKVISQQQQRVVQYRFREGFRRGYEDGYNSRYRYGRNSNGMVLNRTGLSFDQPPSSTEQDPAKRAAAESEAYRRFFDLQRSPAVKRQNRVGQYAWLLMVAIIGSFIGLYMYTVKTTTATTQIVTL